MYAKKILGICSVCVIFFMVNALPMDTIITRTGKIYKLVPLGVVADKTFSPHNLRKRDIIPANFKNDQEESNAKGQGTRVAIVEMPVKEENKDVVNKEKKEIMKTSADTVYPVVYRVRRGAENRRKYEENDDYYDDSDYAGYDRKGSDVGYMDASDDFPTVVW